MPMRTLLLIFNLTFVSLCFAYFLFLYLALFSYHLYYLPTNIMLFNFVTVYQFVYYFSLSDLEYLYNKCQARWV
jgi:hypothetical protein